MFLLLSRHHTYKMSQVRRREMWQKIAESNGDKQSLIEWVCQALGGPKQTKFIKQRVYNEVTKFDRKKKQLQRRSDERETVDPPDDCVVFDPCCSELEFESIDESTPMEIDGEEERSTSPTGSTSSNEERRSSGGGRKSFVSLSASG